MSSLPNRRPFICRFNSAGREFVLDVSSNRIYAITKSQARAFDDWLNGVPLSELAKQYPVEVAQIHQRIRKKLLGCHLPEKLAYGMSWKEISDHILHKRHQTVIELTQRCNLRCKYCTYGGGFADHRVHSEKTMDTATLDRAIASGFEHGDQLKEIVFGFYGGEPLLAWDLLVQAIQNARHRAGTKKVVFSITTNGTLVDSSIAEFLSDHQVHVVLSLDGPQVLHDQHRQFPDGQGSYARAIEGLRTLVDAYPKEQHGLIGLNMVVPSTEWLPTLEQLWHSEPWLPPAMDVQFNFIDPPQGFSYPVPPEGASPDDFEESWVRHCREPGGGAARLRLETSYFDIGMARLHKRPVFDGIRRSFFPNGCCIPATRRAFVEVDGSYRMCERVHGVPRIGDVFNGLDIERVRQIVDEYVAASLPDCRTCWAVSLCRLCFKDAYACGKLDIEQKRKACELQRELLLGDLKTYVAVATEFPRKAAEWDRVEIT